jgi:NAD-dependent dihydropyrimidine dehydrogenase PreA subunit
MAMAYKVLIDLIACDGNGSCTEICPQACFAEPKDGKAVLLEGYECIGCEGCVSSCPKDAITIAGG